MNLLALEAGSTANYAMLVGGSVWLIGELIGVWLNINGSTKPDTTSQWAWIAQSHYPILRPILGVFLISLVGHLLFGTWLLP